jgi:hypothetical protein
MNLLALEKAQSRLRLTARAVQTLQNVGQDPVAFEDHWMDFLVHWKGTYTKVQQAAKDSPQELQWFGGVNSERRGDPLLRWLFEARNDEEHGLIRSAINRPQLQAFTPKSNAVLTAVRQNADGSMTALGADGEEIEGEYGALLPAESSLQEVRERGGMKMPPPTRHKGQQMEPKPLIAAQLGLQWIEGVVAKAQELAKP